MRKELLALPIEDMSGLLLRKQWAQVGTEMPEIVDQVEKFVLSFTHWLGSPVTLEFLLK